jgi:putative ABC transport system permease protein
MQNPNIKLAWRQLQKNKGFTALNIFGLTLGLATFLLITMYVADELSYDRFNINADRICRLNTDILSGGILTSMADAAPPVAPTLLKNYPEVELAARMLMLDDALLLRKGQSVIKETRIVQCDPSIFSIFTLPMIDGNPATALASPHTVVLTERMALKYFGTTAAVGRILPSVGDTTPLTVGGVIRDMPAQACFHFDFFVTMQGNGMQTNGSFWAFFPMSTFVLLKPGTDFQAFNKKLAGLYGQYVPEYKEMEADAKGTWYERVGATPLTDIHLRSSRTDELARNGNIQYVYIFSAIALFVLVIAGINFMNLSTARSANRAREVGVRKVLGSLRSALIGQFLTESLLITLAAGILALGLAALLLPWFNDLADKHLALNPHTLAWVLPMITAAILTVGLLAGAYPALYLSAFKPVQVLKGKLATGFKGGALRSTLVVFQFSISLFLIVGTLVVYRQLSYIRNKDLGFDRSRVLILNGMDALKDPTTFQKELQQIHGVTGATISGYLPTNDKRWHDGGSGPDNGTGNNGGWTQVWKIDDAYLPTLGMRLAAGRNFSRDYGSDTAAVIINEAAAKLFAIEKDPLNKTVTLAWWQRSNRKMNVIGVVKNFNFSSLRDNIQPLVFVNSLDEDAILMAIRANTDNWPALLAQLKQKWTSLVPNRAFEISFMDSDFDGLYRAEQRMGQLSILFSALTILIACLGLFGLAAYAAEQRTSEIGLRKILGASVPNIVGLLLKDFGRLIGLAILIATPLAWLGMDKWLQNFAYRATISPWLFVLAAGIVVLIAAATTIYQSIRAAVANPVETLRTE